MLRSAGLVTLALLLSGGAVGSQELPRVQAEVVQLDAVVTDSTGALVRGLTRDDFEVLEDGKPQTITHFVVAGRKAPGAPGAAPAAPAAAPAPGGEAIPEPSRQIVIVVDDLHIALRDMEATKKALHRLVHEFLLPTDNLALIPVSATGGIERFTRDRGLIDQAIMHLKARPMTVASNSQMTPETAALVLRGDPAALHMAASAIATEPGSVFDGTSPRAAVEAPAGAAGGAPPSASALGDMQLRAAEQQARRDASALLNEALRFSEVTLTAIEDVVRGLAPLPGRKICLLVSDGFLDGSGTREGRGVDLRRILDAATRSGTVVYSLDSRGLMSGSDASMPGRAIPAGLLHQVSRRSEQLLRATLTTVADGTGGFVVSTTNRLAEGLERMLADSDTYYVMAYTPTNTKQDGRFRKIELKVVGHPDYTVRTRTGYFAPDGSKRPPASSKAQAVRAAPAPDLLPEAEAREALSGPVPAAGIPVQLSADYLSLPPAGSQVVVRAHVDLDALRWQQAGDHRRAVVELAGGVYDLSGALVGAPFGRRADLDLNPGEFRRAKSEGLQYQHMLPLAPGTYEVRLVAQTPGAGLRGGASQRILVPDLGNRKLFLSSLFLSAAPTQAQPSNAAPKLRDAQTLREFQRSESLYFQFYVYNAAKGPQGKPDVVIQAQIWSGGKLIGASKPQPARLASKDGAPIPETNAMPLSGMAPGSYELRVLAEDRVAKATTLRRVSFKVD